jgi:hypothetical protein
MLINLENKDLTNTQQMEVAVNGPDGATHLIICTGVANLSPFTEKTYTFGVGPIFTQRQFVGVIVSGAISTIHIENKSLPDGTATELDANLASIDAFFDVESGRVKVTFEVSSSNPMVKLSISYSVHILAELPTCY